MHKIYLILSSITFLSFALSACNQIISERSPTRELSANNVELDQVSYSLGNNTPAIFMDAMALQAQFTPIFGSEHPRGEKWTEELDKRINNNEFRYRGEYIAITPATYFSPEESQSFGTYNINAGLNSSISQGRINFKRNHALSQGYLKSLRAFLADACENRVSLDMTALEQKKTSTAIMHSFAAPSAEDINKLMLSMFGLPATTTILKGAEEYSTVFKEQLKILNDQSEDSEDKETLHKNIASLYKVMCIAIGQDPRVFMR